jgi:hypothetical protein
MPVAVGIGWLSRRKSRERMRVRDVGVRYHHPASLRLLPRPICLPGCSTFMPLIGEAHRNAVLPKGRASSPSEGFHGLTTTRSLISARMGFGLWGSRHRHQSRSSPDIAQRPPRKPRPSAKPGSILCRTNQIVGRHENGSHTAKMLTWVCRSTSAIGG